MNQNPLNFSNKKDRNDFFIALAVILLFSLLFWWLFTGSKPAVIPEIAKAEVPAVVEIADQDGDGIADADDRCPNLMGVADNGGCPLDADEDGVYDADDKCPNYAGTIENNGCPPDGDGDGIHNGLDKCPKLAGVAENDGCPADSDGDGVYDVDDKCPNKPGKASNNGCPEIKLDDAEKQLLKTAVKAVEFETGSAKLKGSSTATLDKIVSLMQKYPAYRLSIKGHTDSQGDPAKNMDLSDRRAKAARTYLVTKGIGAAKINARGFGSKVPVDTNDTPKGRQNNRRVEFDLSY